jgi:hypothetical protein
MRDLPLAGVAELNECWGNEHGKTVPETEKTKK